MRHIISILIENESGALSRVSGLFSARSFNIESLTVAATNDKTLSKMTIVSIGNDNTITQIVKQLNKLIDVVSVADITPKPHFERELLLVKVTGDLVCFANIVKNFEAKLLQKDIAEFTGKSEKIYQFLFALEKFDITELSRTGVTGMSK